jgi:sugar/nucleoside kinase (ribokinase family)
VAMLPNIDLLSIGSALEDIFVRSDRVTIVDNYDAETGQVLMLPLGAKLEAQLIQHEIGGGGANTSVFFSRLGIRTGLIARLGKDRAAAVIAEALDNEGVVTDYLIADAEHSSGKSVLIMAPNGNRTVLAQRGAGGLFQPEEIREDVVSQAKWIYLSSIGGDRQTLLKIFALSHIHQVKIAWNPGMKELELGAHVLVPMLQQTAVLILNREEAAFLTKLPHQSSEALLNRLISMLGTGIVVITDGARGAVAYDGRQIETLPGHAVSVVDATGAGDAFGSGFVAAHYLGSGMDQALSFALHNAESVIGQVGAQAGLLRREDLTKQKIIADIIHEPYLP